MSQDNEVDHILRRGHDVTPSPTFVRGVMYAIEKEARSAPPLAFPWKLALPGFGVWVSTSIWVIATVVVAAARDSVATPSSPDLGIARFLELWQATRATWIVSALIPSVTIFKLFTRVSPR